jgi:hypothetical protein
MNRLRVLVRRKRNPRLKSWELAGALKLTEEQMQWLRMIKDYVAASFHIEKSRRDAFGR